MAAKIITNPFLATFTGNVQTWAMSFPRDVYTALTQIATRLNVALMEDGSEAMTGPLALQVVTYANLPAPGTPGRTLVVSNASVNAWGATIDGAGAGANQVLGWDNGTHWTVVGK